MIVVEQRVEDDALDPGLDDAHLAPVLDGGERLGVERLDVRDAAGHEQEDDALRFRGVVIAMACLVLGYGVYITLHSKYDVYPEFAPPRVVIQTEAPGLAPEQVEALVTRPVENAVNGVAGLDTLRSQSVQGLSVVTVAFGDKVEYRVGASESEGRNLMPAPALQFHVMKWAYERGMRCYDLVAIPNADTPADATIIDRRACVRTATARSTR